MCDRAKIPAKGGRSKISSNDAGNKKLWGANEGEKVDEVWLNGVHSVNGGQRNKVID